MSYWIYTLWYKFLQLEIVFVMIFTKVPWPCFHFNTSCMNNILLVAMRTFSGPYFCVFLPCSIICSRKRLSPLACDYFRRLTCFLFWIDFTSTRARHIFSLWFPITDTIYNKILNCFFAVIDARSIQNHRRSFFFPTCSFPFLNKHG